MKSVLPVLAVALACSTAIAAHATQAPQFEIAKVERWRAAMESARWTGPLLASTAETLPQGHFYTEPYFFDVISGGKHSPGSSGFYQYGLFDSFTVGLQPDLAFGTDRANRRVALGDIKILSQLRLTHFTAEHRVPTVALVLNQVLPTGKYDRLGSSKNGHGSGSFTTEVGISVQNYWLLRNGRLLRGRINVLKSFPYGTAVDGRSVYGTGPGFHGRATPGSRTTLIGAVEYSLSHEWALALDIEGDSWAKTTVVGRDGSGGPPMKQTIPSSWSVGFAPAVEYNWSDRSGAVLGLWVIPKGHNTPTSVMPAIAIQRYW